MLEWNPHEWEVNQQENAERPLHHTSCWYTCKNCGATVVAATGADLSTVHRGWKVPVDCNETIVLIVMDS